MAVAELAREQNDVISTRQLASCGVDTDATAVRVARGQLHRIHRGVYAVGTGALTLRGRLAAAVLACGDDAVLGHRAAAAWWEMLPWPGGPVDVIVPRGAGRRRDAIRPRWSRSLDPRDVWTRDNIRITSPARTVLDLAPGMAPEAYRRTVRQALAEGRVSVRQLTAVLARAPRHLGAAKLRKLVADGYVPTRSALEDLALDLITHAGIERPEINPRLRFDGRTIRPDMLWRDRHVAIELDSRRWHHDLLTREDDAEKQAILEAHGHHVMRITWHQIVNRPTQTIARIRAAVTAAPSAGHMQRSSSTHPGR